MGEPLGKASVQYGDPRGTVSIDGPDEDERLYELAGLFREKWFIVAYELYGSYDSTGAYVWAVPNDQASFDGWAKLARDGERTIPSRRFEFQLEDDDAALILLKLNKRWSIHALFRSLADLDLDIEREV